MPSVASGGRTTRHSGAIPGQVTVQPLPSAPVLSPLSMKFTPKGKPVCPSLVTTDRAGVGDPMLVIVTWSGEKGAPMASQVAVLPLVIVGGIAVPSGLTISVNDWVISCVSSRNPVKAPIVKWYVPGVVGMP